MIPNEVFTRYKEALTALSEAGREVSSTVSGPQPIEYNRLHAVFQKEEECQREFESARKELWQFYRGHTK